jgi:hypothetical protein
VSDPINKVVREAVQGEIDARIEDLRDTFIVTVLSGEWPQNRPDLGITYVRKLNAMVQAAFPVKDRASFVCFTDREIPGIVTRYLPPWLPGWWGKLYAFAPSNFPLGSRVLVLDLDTVVRRLDQILAVDLERPIYIRDAAFRTHAGSGVFSFRTGTASARIWRDFPHGSKGPPFMHPVAGPKVTDEHWMHHYLPAGDWLGWDEVLPGRVLSYKHDLHQSCEPLPPECDLVFFDGEPRPHDVVADWNPHWRGVHEG